MLVVFDKNVRFFGIGNAAQLTSMVSVVTEGAPNAPISPNNYRIEAFDGALLPANFNSPVNDVRMILITFHNQNPPDAVRITVNANLLWNGNTFVDGQFVLNSGFSTDFLPMVP